MAIEKVDLPKGFMGTVIDPDKPQAIRKVVRGSDGLPKTILIDAATGQQLANGDGYQVVESGGGTYAAVAPNQETNPGVLGNNDKPARIENMYGYGEGGRFDPASNAMANTAQNNFGYIDKPGWVGMTGLLPGAAGMVGKAVNVGININNASAKRQAREAMGLETSPGELVGGAFKDNKGQFGDIQIGSNDYSVGAEALSPQGRTNMTVQEAINHSRANKAPIQAIDTRGKVAGTTERRGLLTQAIDAFIPDAKENRKPGGGLITQTVNHVADFIDSLFTDNVKTSSTHPSTSTGFFPGAPAADREFTSPGGQTRNISNAVGGLSSIDNSPDDRDNRGNPNQGGGGVTSGGTGLW